MLLLLLLLFAVGGASSTLLLPRDDNSTSPGDMSGSCYVGGVAADGDKRTLNATCAGYDHSRMSFYVRANLVDLNEHFSWNGSDLKYGGGGFSQACGQCDVLPQQSDDRAARLGWTNEFYPVDSQSQDPQGITLMCTCDDGRRHTLGLDALPIRTDNGTLVWG